MFSFLWICFFSYCFSICWNEFADNVFHMCLLNLLCWMVRSQMDQVRWLSQRMPSYLPIRLLGQKEQGRCNYHFSFWDLIVWFVLCGLIAGFHFLLFYDSSVELWWWLNLYTLYGMKKRKGEKILIIFHKMGMGKFEGIIESYFQVCVKKNQLPGV